MDGHDDNNLEVANAGVKRNLFHDLTFATLTKLLTCATKQDATNSFRKLLNTEGQFITRVSRNNNLHFVGDLYFFFVAKTKSPLYLFFFVSLLFTAYLLLSRTTTATS